MHLHRRAIALAGCVVGSAAFMNVALADPNPDPVYTYFELDDMAFGVAQGTSAPVDNDICQDGFFNDLSEQIFVGNLADALRDCFYIDGKLRLDWVWGREPKCAIVAYDKPELCYNAQGQPNPDPREPVIGASTSGLLTVPTVPDQPGAPPGSGPGTIRLGVGMSLDYASDGSLNGLLYNALHGEYGLLCVEIRWLDSTGNRIPPAPPQDPFGPNQSVNVNLNGGSACRVAFRTPSGVASVEIICRDDCGTAPVCYDIDYYTIRRLRPAELYCMTVVCGRDDDCAQTDTLLLGFQKGWVPTFGTPWDDDGGAGVFSELCLTSSPEEGPNGNIDGVIRIAVTGGGQGADYNGNGLSDDLEGGYFDFLEMFDLGMFRPGASLHDASAGRVIRIPNYDHIGFPDHRLYDSYPQYQVPPGHGICGGYCIKVRRSNHGGPGSSPDLNGDGSINAEDLALLLGAWGANP